MMRRNMGFGHVVSEHVPVRPRNNADGARTAVDIIRLWPPGWQASVRHPACQEAYPWYSGVVCSNGNALCACGCATWGALRYT